MVFIPLLASQQYENAKQTVLAAIAFALTASSIYLLNDIIDVKDDRLHYRKKTRPFAAGELSLAQGWLLFPLPLLAGFAIASFTLPDAFIGILTAYLVLALLYCAWIKRIVIADVLTLAVLYELRILGGAAAIGVTASVWLLTFSMFMFLSLALMKRLSELKSARLEGYTGATLGRGYTVSDFKIVLAFGVTCGCLAMFVLALYIHDSHARALYRTPDLLWLSWLLLSYWIGRAWLLALRGQLHDDPIAFALADKVSWAVVTTLLIVILAAQLLP